MTELKKYKRVILKLSGEALAGEKGFGIKCGSCLRYRQNKSKRCCWKAV